MGYDQFHHANYPGSLVYDEGTIQIHEGVGPVGQAGLDHGICLFLGCEGFTESHVSGIFSFGFARINQPTNVRGSCRFPNDATTRFALIQFGRIVC